MSRCRSVRDRFEFVQAADLVENLLGVGDHRVPELLETVEHIENRLVVIDFEVGVADGLEIELAPIDLVAFERVVAFAVGGDQPRAVELGATVFVNEPELNGEPEQACQARGVFLVVGVKRGLAVGLEEVREDGIGTCPKTS